MTLTIFIIHNIDSNEIHCDFKKFVAFYLDLIDTSPDLEMKVPIGI